MDDLQAFGFAAGPPAALWSCALLQSLIEKIGQARSRKRQLKLRGIARLGLVFAREFSLLDNIAVGVEHR
nr:hypothetical protein [Mesorhizobium jarvisii]